VHNLCKSITCTQPILSWAQGCIHAITVLLVPCVGCNSACIYWNVCMMLSKADHKLLAYFTAVLHAQQVDKWEPYFEGTYTYSCLSTHIIAATCINVYTHCSSVGNSNCTQVCWTCNLETSHLLLLIDVMVVSTFTLIVRIKCYTAVIIRYPILCTLCVVCYIQRTTNISSAIEARMSPLLRYLHIHTLLIQLISISIAMCVLALQHIAMHAYVTVYASTHLRVKA
jgi:hypothetical protein